MTRSNVLPETQGDRAEKARMLITILGNDFTRKSSHPFFRSLTETAAQPTETPRDSPDISRALRNLMSHLSSQKSTQGMAADVPTKAAVFASETYVSPDQHPALIASTLAKFDGTKRRNILRTFNGPLACRVLVYMREIEEKSATEAGH